jgi:hypothetical protein
MVPLVIDTGASVTVTPYVTDLTSAITPVQLVEIKGIAEGLQVRGNGTVCYNYYNNAGDLVNLTIPNCLYVPQCTARLLCPRQVATITQHPDDGFYAKQQSSILYYNGQPTTITYDSTSGLPLLYTTLLSVHNFSKIINYTPGHYLTITIFFN